MNARRLLCVVGIVWVILSFVPAHTAGLSAEVEEDEDDLSNVESVDDEPVNTGASQFEFNMMDENTDPNADIFVPTANWQTIKKGQPVPKGLHYRMNLQTGLMEAKLLDEEDSQQNKPVMSDRKDLLPTEEEPQANEDSRLLRMKKAMEDAMEELGEKEEKGKVKYWQKDGKEGMMRLRDMTFSRDQLKDALQKFKLKDDDVKEETSETPAFRSMKDIKADFDELNLKMKTDIEILRSLLNRYQEEELSEDDHVMLLNELEYYLHQIDNAVDFAEMGGLELVIKDLNHTSEKVRTEAAFVLGSAAQSNPKVQVKVLQLGGPHKLIRMVSTESSDIVRSRALYALSCSMRHFPYAQKSFIDNGGVHTLTSAVTQETSHKLRLKALTLAVDLLQERSQVELHSNIGQTTEFERLQQYKKVPLHASLLEQGWCKVIPRFLTDPDHDTREKVLIAMDLLGETCHDHFKLLSKELLRVQAEYKILSKEEIEEDGEEGYFSGLYKLATDLTKKLELRGKQHLPKQEL